LTQFQRSACHVQWWGEYPAACAVFFFGISFWSPRATAKRKSATADGNSCQYISHPGGPHGYLVFDLKLIDQAMRRTVNVLHQQKISGTYAPSNFCCVLPSKR
jgi:hypothetical protein